ncbi:MAG: GAF domain-containing protein [bacterium]|nr:GAF domain-containing protein [bacterium]
MTERDCDLFDHLPVGCIVADRTGAIRRANRAAVELLGHDFTALNGRALGEIIAIPSGAERAAGSEDGRAAGPWMVAIIDPPGSDRFLEATVSFIGDDTCWCLSDVSEFRESTTVGHATIELLSRLASNSDLDARLIKALDYLQELTGCEVSGLRLREGDDFPYFATSGMSQDFVVDEAKLCSRRADGTLNLTTDGRPVLDCMCGAVINAHTNPTKPYFTNGGSFWTNSTSSLVDVLEQPDPNAKVRFRCHREGYESVALIPLRSNDEVFGLIQLNDSRSDVFTDDTIAMLEKLSGHIASVLE